MDTKDITSIPVDLLDLLQRLGAAIGEALASREADDTDGLNDALDRAGGLLVQLDSWIYSGSSDKSAETK